MNTLAFCDRHSRLTQARVGGRSIRGTPWFPCAWFLRFPFEWLASWSLFQCLLAQTRGPQFKKLRLTRPEDQHLLDEVVEGDERHGRFSLEPERHRPAAG